MFNVNLSNLEKDATKWTTVIDSSVNSTASLGFQASNLPDGRLKVTNVGSVAWAGGLVTRKLPIPQFVGTGAPAGGFLSYAQLSTFVTIPATSLYNVARLETDFIVIFTPAPNGSTPITNKANCSTQLNFDTGNFMVDASSGNASWSDIGSGPGKNIAPDVEHSMVLKFAFNIANQKRSVQSITWDGVVYPVPATLQNITFQPSNWGQVAVIQKQTEIYKPGSADIIYRATSVDWSDQPF